MWHLKTKLGTFWLVEASNNTEQYLLGINDQELGTYQDANIAAHDVYEQATGYFKWDSQAKIKAPTNITEWLEGAPDNWAS